MKRLGAALLAAVLLFAIPMSHAGGKGSGGGHGGGQHRGSGGGHDGGQHRGSGGGHDKGHERGHGGGGRHGSFIGHYSYWDPFYSPFYNPYYYPYYDSYYGPRRYPRRGTVVRPIVYVQKSEPGRPYYWYYCKKPDGFYPYVRECPGGWTQVVPQIPES